MITSHCLSLLTMVLLYPAPRDPEPDDKGKGFFGVQLVDNGGVQITRVEPGSPADKAGIRINDVIRAIDAVGVPTVEDAREIIGRLRPGHITRVEVRRGATNVNLRVKVGIRPDWLP